MRHGFDPFRLLAQNYWTRRVMEIGFFTNSAEVGEDARCAGEQSAKIAITDRVDGHKALRGETGPGEGLARPGMDGSTTKAGYAVKCCW